MKTMNYRLLLVAIAWSFGTTASVDTLTIGARGAGFFSEFFMVLNWCSYAENHGLTPFAYWDKVSLYYQEEGFRGKTNAWEYYFKQLSEGTYQEAAPIRREYGSEWAIDSFDPLFVKKNRRYVRSLIDKYIHLQPWIAQEVEDFYQACMAGKKTIGIHVRRTDKGCEVPLVSLVNYLTSAREFVRKFPQCQFLIATDDKKTLRFLKKHLPGPVIFYNALRSENGKPVHINSPQPARIGKDVLIEMLLLSCCDFLIHGQSNVAIAALFFNPAMPHVWLKVPGSTKTIRSTNNIFFLEEAECFSAYYWLF